MLTVNGHQVAVPVALAAVIAFGLTLYILGMLAGFELRRIRTERVQREQMRAVRAADMESSEGPGPAGRIPDGRGDLAGDDTVRGGEASGGAEAARPREVLSAEDQAAEAEADAYVTALRPPAVARHQSWAAGGLHYLADMTARYEAEQEGFMLAMRGHVKLYDEWLSEQPWAWTEAA